MENNNKVDHPSHYNRKDGMECIDEMILLFGIEEVKAFCKLNAWKYRYRAADKNGEEDLKKSDWYINKYKELTNSSSFEYKDNISPHNIYQTPYNIYHTTPLQETDYFKTTW